MLKHTVHPTLAMIISPVRARNGAHHQKSCRTRVQVEADPLLRQPRAKQGLNTTYMPFEVSALMTVGGMPTLLGLTM